MFSELPGLDAAVQAVHWIARFPPVHDKAEAIAFQSAHVGRRDNHAARLDRRQPAHQDSGYVELEPIPDGVALPAGPGWSFVARRSIGELYPQWPAVAAFAECQLVLPAGRSAFREDG